MTSETRDLGRPRSTPAELPPAPANIPPDTMSVRDALDHIIGCLDSGGEQSRAFADEIRIGREALEATAFAAYVERGGTGCPWCGPEADISAGSLTVEAGECMQRISCIANDDHNWWDCYKLASAELDA